MNDESKQSLFADILRGRRSVREFYERPLAKTIVQSLVWAAQGKTDSAGNRTAPSAHGLHPIRVFVMAADVEAMTTGFYAVDHDSGELQLIHERDVRPELEAAALEEQPWIGSAPCVISICADFVNPVSAFADQPPEGKRGFRYVYIEAGACAQNALLHATCMGVGGVLVAGFNDEATAEVLRLPEPLTPVMHLCFGWPAG